MARPKKNQDSEYKNNVLLERTYGAEVQSKDSSSNALNKIFKIQNKNLKDELVSCLDGVQVSFDKDGIAEVREERVANYLLSIPSYKRYE